MIQSKLPPKKRTQTFIQLKQSEPEIKRKKSSTHIGTSSKIKKQQIPDKPLKKPKQQKKPVHSSSKGKISRKHLKSEKNDENFNSLNHKKSVQKIHCANKASKQLKTKKSTEQLCFAKKEDKPKHSVTERTLTKASSEAKLHTKKVYKKKGQFYGEQKQLQKGLPKTLSRNPTSKKILPINTKIKQPSSHSTHTQSVSNQRRSTRQKARPKHKISDIIQRSILYSDVNYEFKEQISFLGSGIKKEENFFLSYPFQSGQSQLHAYQSQFMNYESVEKINAQNKAATTIQRHFRGYIQRKYIEEAKYIVECIKRIQRCWRAYREKRRLSKDKQIAKGLETVRGEKEVSLITIKDLNDTAKLQKRQVAEVQQSGYKSRSSFEDENNKNALKDIIKNLLSEENLNEAIKQKIRNAMSDNELTKFKSQSQQREKKFSGKLSTLKPVITQLSLEQDQNDSNKKQFYVKKKLSMEINSEKYFNSPMNSNHNFVDNNVGGNSSSSGSKFLASPGVKKMVSPKCISNSLSKQIKASYTNYFKSCKNPGFCSPTKNQQSNEKRTMRSHSGSKPQKENIKDLVNRDYKDLSSIPLEGENDFVFEQSQKSCAKNTNPSQEEYLLNADMGPTSPIVERRSRSPEKQQSESEVNLLSTQKLSELQTRRAPQLRPFPTEFCFIEEFCLLITDYLRQDADTAEAFLQKVRGLKYFKIQSVFKSWQNLEFEQLSSENEPLKNMILKSSFERPPIFSRSEKRLLLQYPSLRLFLNQNDYADSQIFNESSPQNSYIRFMFDVFEESIYDDFKHVSIEDLRAITAAQTKQSIQYIDNVLSRAATKILISAQFLCGIFQTDDMTEVEKEQRQAINSIRQEDLIKEFIQEPFDMSQCKLWINMLLSKMVFQELISELTEML